MSDSSPRSAVGKPLAATLSIHGDFLEKAVPQWLVDATPARRLALKQSTAALPGWYKNASPEQRKTVTASVKASTLAQTRLDNTMATFQDVDAFAKPLLLKALKDQFQVDVDVDKTLLCLRRPLAVTVLELEVASFEFLKLSMLQAALHNFEAWECASGAYHKSSGFVVQASSPDTYEPTTVNLTVSQFLTLCRSLDVGAKYQAYLKTFFEPADATAKATLRQQFIASQKTAMRAAADQALLTRDIEPADHAMIVSVINGEVHPRMGKKQVWFNDMGLMRKRMTGCVAFVICEKYRYNDEVILYIPQDPVHPLKRYTVAQMRQTFKRLFTARDGMQSSDASPTTYQRFFSQFVPYAQRGYYFSQFTQEAADSPGGPLTSPWRTIIETVSEVSPVTHIKELPPARPAKMEPAPDPYIAPSYVTRKGRGPWADNVDLWDYLFEQNRDKAYADARSHAVPTAEVDIKAREAKLAHLLEIGMLGLNMVSMFVPVLGEIMMVVMAGQLLYETLEGSIEWAEGDKRAAKAHLVDVAENLAQLAVMAGVGAAVSTFRAARPEPVIENLSPVTLPNGETRLWKPDLSGYESAVTLEASPGPNALGQHHLEGKTYIRQGNKVYEQCFDDSIKQWRIKHPSDADAYQPILHSNGRGAWRHTLERPLAWDRLTLLRRIGHATEAFSDTELIKVADVSGVSDNALRKMHMDLAAPPPELTDAMRLFKADTDTGQVIDQLRGTQPIDDRYLYALPLVAEMPGWPKARVLEVFEAPGLSGASVKYGSERLLRGAAAKAPIKISRSDILGGQLPAHILAALDEQEVIGLLGAQGARVVEQRPQEFGKQLTEYAQTRKPAIFDSIYAGTEPVASQVRQLQRRCPGLSEAGAQEALAHARPDDLKQLHATRRVPLTLLEEARWYARQGRQTRAYAGLRSENMASADSRRLALHCLEKLPGWPDTLRLEVREVSDSGLLLDSIGSATARDKKYLVKKGPRFQAFNERGEALNSLPKEGDNFYASLMHALPDEARRGLGVPQVSQSAELQEKIIDFADRYRSETPQLLEPQGRLPKPPVRINDTLIGYYASGRDSNLRAHLVVRARALYPELSDAQAGGFIRQLQQPGRSGREIYNILQNREREYTALVRTLDQWVGQPAVAPNPFSAAPDNSAFLHRTQVARELKAAWQRAPLAGEVPNATRLSIVINQPLPPLTADFAHIRELSVGGRGLNDANADAFLAQFPNVHTLSIGERRFAWDRNLLGQPSLTTVPQAVSEMAQLNSLTFRADASLLAADFSSRLNALTALEALHIECSGFSPTALDSLDLSALVQLKRLQIDAPHTLSQWPAYVEGFTRLERLDLANTSIRTLPERLYLGHEQLWAGLSLDWSKFSREAFKPAFLYVKHYPADAGHLVDLHQMVRDYARGELTLLFGPSEITTALHAKVMTWNTPESRFAAVEFLSDEHSGLFGQFYLPRTSDGPRLHMRAAPWQMGRNAQVISALEHSWRGAVAKRYSLDANVSVFELPMPGAHETVPVADGSVVELPQLPAGTFSHVQTLRLDRIGTSIEQTRGFIRAFSGTQTLELRGVGLTEVPIGAGELPALTRLDLSDNRLVVTPAVQEQLNGLHSLELLDLRNNRLNQLDVSALTRLKALNLRAAQLKAWPTGAQGLPQLSWIDLRDNQIPTLPPEVLANDEALLKVNLAGNTFSPSGATALKEAQQRIESAKGLPEGTLDRFALETLPPEFPPEETALSIAHHLLPLPQRAAGLEGESGFLRNLQLLNPAITEDQALQRLKQLRNQGMSEPQIDEQLTQWHQDGEALTRQLNSWLFIREVQAAQFSLSAEDRGLAAWRIRQCWQDGLLGGTDQTLSLEGTQTGDLPALNVQFPQVSTLDLTGVRFSAQGSNGFLEAFPQLNRLVLSGNALTQLPEAVGGMRQLERLELAANSFSSAQSLYRQLGGERLRWLGLSNNSLSEFSLQAFTRLQTLDLSYNPILHWPDGALEAAHLRRLNLSGNRFTTFPDRLLGGNHDGLVAGTRLTDCRDLSLNSLEQLRDYSDSQGRADVMGRTWQDLDLKIRELENDSDIGSGSEGDPGSDGDSDPDDDSGPDAGGNAHGNVQTPESIDDSELEVDAQALEPWLADTRADLRALRSDLWTQLAQEHNHQRFFHLISMLRLTDEFRYARVGLTHRVWEVMQAASENTELRQLLFHNAETHGTCADGRILTFSDVEIRVYEYNTLRTIPLQQTEQRGRALMNLSRRLFRLDRVEALAEAVVVEAAKRPEDAAEVRLEYRIGLTQGWPDGLELPGQPANMQYGTPISGQRLAAARASVLEAERSDAFFLDLISRDYWVRYLTERYPEAFAELEENASIRQDQVEDEHSGRDDSAQSLERYISAIEVLKKERDTARTKKLVELSRREEQRLAPGVEEPQPGPSRLA